MDQSDDATIRTFPDHIQILARARTPFNDIFVLKEGTQRAIWFNREGEFFLQSRFDSAQPHALSLVYSQLILTALIFRPQPANILCIGMGAGVLPRSLAFQYPEAQIDIVEIDPQVVHMAKRYFEFEESPLCRVHVGDGRLFLAKQGAGKNYDIVFLDAFKSGSVPYHLKTCEFYGELQSALSPEGVVASNLYGKSNTLKPSDRMTFRTHFPQVYVFEDPDRVATVSVAAQHTERWSREAIRKSAVAVRLTPELKVSLDEVAHYLAEEDLGTEQGRVFRDNFKPEDMEQVCRDHNRFHFSRNPLYPIRPVS